MKTTGINKTVYRSNIISVLDSFTSVRNVLAWEMFQDGQVRNYDGVIGDFKRLYPEIDFDSVTENINPENIAADEDAIYVLVDNIINKLIESGISKDNFNYAIWACDNPENVADTYGVELEDVSAYKITDGILLQDLGYEGQLYGVAEYPEEEWDVIESALKDENIEQYLSDEKVPIDYFSLFFDWVTVPDYESDEQLKSDIEWFYEDYYISDEDMNKIVANLRKLHEDFNNENGNQKYIFSIDEMDKAEKWISDTLGPDALNVQATKYKGPSIAEQIGTMPPEKMDLMYEVVNSRQMKSGYERNCDSIRKIFFFGNGS